MLTDFEFSVPDSDLTRLRARLAEARLPEQTPGPDWSRGIPVGVLEGLRDLWRDAYDWRTHEHRLGQEQHLLYEDPAARLHLVRRAGQRAGALPVLAIHGWPYTYAQMLPLADALEGSREVVVPSLPGFGHSPALREPFSAQGVAHIFHRLMTGALGHERYLVYGEDIGAPIADWIAGLYPEAVAGIVTAHPSFSAQAREGHPLDADELAFLASTHRPEESGYAHVQGTRPDTLAAGLLDSPIGLLAWVAEKVAAWSDGGHESGLRAFDSDEILTLVSLYWYTRSIGTSFRSYCEPTDFDLHPVVTVPAAVLINTHEATYPESLARKSYAELLSFSRMESGGHFTAWENPPAIAHAIRELARQVGA